jgi:hypothetical protein
VPPLAAGPNGLLIIASGLFCVALALRLPFMSQYLWAWDSVLYANAIASFDVADGRPHPPGYLFYVLTARAAAWLAGGANAGLVLVSVVAGAATVAIGFVAGTRISRRIGVLAGVVLLSSPLLWHYSEVAYPYTVLAMLSGLIGAALWAARTRRLRAALAASAVLGIACGFRQDLLAILGPLWLWSMVGRGWRAGALGVLAVGLGCLVWLAPTALLSQGLERYLAVVWSQASGVSTLAAPERDVVWRNLAMTAVGLRWQLHWLLPVLPIAAVVLLRRRDVAVPLSLWVMPALLVYLVFHIGEWAYTLSVAVPLALLAALGCDALLRAAGAQLIRGVVAVGLAAGIALNGHSFLFGEGRFSVKAIVGHDVGLRARIETIRERFSPEDTVILARGGTQHARYYLPEYRVQYVARGHGRPAIRFPPGSRQAVLFLREVGAHPRALSRSVPSRYGVDIWYLPVDQGARFVVIDGDLFVVTE